MLSALCNGLPGVRLERGDARISGVEIDSRQVQPGSLYVALPGVYLHGLKFVDDAIAKGAAAVAVPDDAELQADLPIVRLDQPRKCLPRLAARFFGDPSTKLKLVGVTGTNGKTTVTTMLAGIARAAGRVPGLIGTGKQVIGDDERETRFTTPEAPTIQALLAEMVESGVSVAAMEVSSVGLQEDRVEETQFAAAGWLNLTQDHLDYHADMDEYARAKWRLLEDLLAPGGTAVVNVEDPEGERLAARLPKVWRLRLDTPADVYFTALHMDANGCHGTLKTPLGELRIRCPMPGRFNAMNAALAAALAQSVGLADDAIHAGLAGIAVPGRMQSVPNDRGIAVVVDYAHSADSLERVIETLRPLTAGRLLTVFGCGGDRDATKRAPMGVAAAASDAVVVTNDNPRGEDPAAIAEAAAVGVRSAGKKAVDDLGQDGFCVELDRRAAIQMAIGAAARATRF